MMRWIQTYTGRRFFPLDPRPEDVCIEDIAHALSLKCRFGGHCREFYSVADHSVRVSRCVAPQLALWGLMHDAAEAYLPDLGAPVKSRFHVECAGNHERFCDAEDRLLAVIARALGFPEVDYETVRKADLQLLATEARDLMAPPPEPWDLGVGALSDRIVPLSPTQAESAFLGRFRQLTASSAAV